MNVIKQLISAKAAKLKLQSLKNDQINSILQSIAKSIVVHRDELLRANEMDIKKMELDDPKIDRLLLTNERIEELSKSITSILELPNPSYQTVSHKTLKNGLQLEKITNPIGVVGVIYESRPNVTFDVAGLCLKSQNACVLKGSKEAEYTNRVAVKIIHTVLESNYLPTELITLLPSDRSSIETMCTATEYLDVIIPRGSDGLIQHVRKNSLVPVIETGAGVCHTYVHESADWDQALSIIINAKVSRPSVCNALDTIILDQKIAIDFCNQLLPKLYEHHVKLYVDEEIMQTFKNQYPLNPSSHETLSTEWLSLQCNIITVPNLQHALEHIDKYSTKHSECIIAKDDNIYQQFIKMVDAAVVYSNASTRFTDGGVFELGAEIGISTQKLHARGPFALEKLVTEKWIVRGNGQIRN